MRRSAENIPSFPDDRGSSEELSRKDSEIIEWAEFTLKEIKKQNAVQINEKSRDPENLYFYFNEAIKYRIPELINLKERLAGLEGKRKVADLIHRLEAEIPEGYEFKEIKN